MESRVTGMQPDCDSHVRVDTVSRELQLELQKGISQAGRVGEH